MSEVTGGWRCIVVSEVANLPVVALAHSSPLKIDTAVVIKERAAREPIWAAVIAWGVEEDGWEGESALARRPYSIMAVQVSHTPMRVAWQE